MSSRRGPASVSSALVRVGLTAISLVLVPAAARAEDSWSTPHPGVRLLDRVTTTPNRIHALVVDLCAPGVGIRATASDERRRTVSSFGQLVGAEAAVNGDFFSFETYATTGLAMGAGERWDDTSDKDWSGFVAFGPAEAFISLPSELVDEPPEGISEIVSGRPLIVRNGEAIHDYSCSSHYCERHPRTAVGLSQDRRTLYLVVVDGRSSSSLGMTMAQLADLLDGLGAYTALNFDGGGSTAMWISGTGVVNAPSDGSQRVVANHLAVHATGSGLPTSCPITGEGEMALQPDILSPLGTSDIDGDGLADACARASAGFLCYPSTGVGFPTRVDGPVLSDDSGWGDVTNYATIRMGDLNGDGLADVCARANAGMRCWPSVGTGFDASLVGPELSDESGWSDVSYYSTIRMADVTGDGQDDLCARSSAGFACWPSTESGFGSALAAAPLSDEAGWRSPRFCGTIRMGDIDGDGRVDLCARASAGVYCWIAADDGFSTRITGPLWSDAEGWSEIDHWSTIRMADLDGDWRADLCGRSADGIVCSRSLGDSFGPELAGPALSDDTGWADHSNYSTIRFADVNGDGRDDLCARANAGVSCWPSNGEGFGDTIAGPELADEHGWSYERFYRTIRLADVTGDGLADLCARHSGGLRCWISDGAGFPTEVDGPTWADSVGWGGVRYYSTVQVAGPRRSCDPTDEVCNGLDDDCDREVDEGCGADGDADLDADDDPGSDGDLPDGDEPGDSGDAADADGGTGGDLTGGCSCRAAAAARHPRSVVGPAALLHGLWIR